jgi:hypothetical protein
VYRTVRAWGYGCPQTEHDLDHPANRIGIGVIARELADIATELDRLPQSLASAGA